MAGLTWGQGGAQIDAGAYDATFIGHEICDPTPRSPNQNQWQRWTFLVHDGSADGVELVSATSIMTGPKSNAYKYLTAILGRPIEPGEQIDPGALCPEDCRLVVKQDPESGFVRVTDVLPARSVSAKTPQPQAKPVQRRFPDDDVPF